MAKQTTIGQCRLCLNERVLVGSHIIANFLYKPLKQIDGYFLKHSPEQQRLFKEQQGITEKLLCAECDSKRLGKYEHHLARVLNQGAAKWTRIEPKVYLITGYDYKMLKNALLAMLWRMSITTRDFFSDVDLGVIENERLRVGLLNDDEFPESAFPIFLSALLVNNQISRSMIASPSSNDTALGNRAIHCPVGGLLYLFVVGPAALPDRVQLLNLTKTGWLCLVENFTDIPFLRDLGARLLKARRLTK